MPLKITKHKSYNPFSKDNIARVRRDEEKAELEEQQRAGRTLQAESEARLSLLRSEAKKKRNTVKDAERALDRQLGGQPGRERESMAVIVRPGSEGPVASTSRSIVSSIQGADGHVNFFADAERGIVPVAAQAGNAEYAAEKKRELDRKDNFACLALAGPAKDLRPWYADRDLRSFDELERTNEERVEHAYKEGEAKRMSDPLALVSAYLRRREDVQADNERRQRDPFAATPTPRRFEPVGTKLLRPGRRDRERQRALDDSRAEAEEADAFRPAPPPKADAAVSMRTASEVSTSREELAAAAALREGSERERAVALIRAKRKASAVTTPRTDGGYDRYNPEYARSAKHRRSDEWRGSQDRDCGERGRW